MVFDPPAGGSSIDTITVRLFAQSQKAPSLSDLTAALEDCGGLLRITFHLSQFLQMNKNCELFARVFGYHLLTLFSNLLFSSFQKCKSWSEAHKPFVFGTCT